MGIAIHTRDLRAGPVRDLQAVSVIASMGLICGWAFEGGDGACVARRDFPILGDLVTRRW